MPDDFEKTFDEWLQGADFALQHPTADALADALIRRAGASVATEFSQEIEAVRNGFASWQPRILVSGYWKGKFSLAMSKKIGSVTPRAMQILQEHSWPGNVRELENAVERAMVVAQEPELREQDFTLKLQHNGAEGRTLDEMERAHILRVLDECSGNQTRAAQVLDIDRVTLYNKLKRYGWKRPHGEALNEELTSADRKK